MDLKRKVFVKKAAALNEKANNLLVRVGSLITEDVWLEKITLTTDVMKNAQTVLVEGKSLRPDPIDGIRNELNRSLGRDDLIVEKLDRGTNEDGQEHYLWTIITKSPDAAKDPNAAPTEASPAQPGHGGH